jgi:hypothetical protein
MRGDAREVSAGYRVNYDPTPGVTDSGEHYDGIQKEINLAITSPLFVGAELARR